MSNQITIEKPGPPAIVEELAPVVQEAMNFSIVGIETHGHALERIKKLRIGERTIHDWFEPSRKAADSAKKEIITLRESMAGPIKQARMVYEQSATVYQLAEQRKAREKMEQLQAQARKEEEDRKLREVDEALEAGYIDQAEQILEEPIEVPQVAVAPPVAHVKGVSQRRTYKVRVVDLVALVDYVAENPTWLHLLVPAYTALNSLARSQREAFKLPGCELVVETSMAVRG